MRLAPQPHERIDRSQEIHFSFDGRTVVGYEGDTIGSALYAAGTRVFSRSFKYHRRRGLLCCSGHCPNCMMAVDGAPNVRVCAEPLREGVRVRAQNVRGSLDHDLMGVVDRFGGPFTPVGFYYRTFIRPRALWPFYHAEGIARDVRNATTADWSEDHMFGCLAWLYDGFALPSEGEEARPRLQSGSRL